MREDGYEPKRLALLRILQILEEYSDCEHPMTQQEIAERLDRDYGIFLERKAIGRNIQLLNDAGFEITSRENRGVYLSSRRFEEGELRLLIDSVTFSRHIPPKYADELIGKLRSCGSKYFGKSVHLVRGADLLYCSQSKDIFYLIELLNDAIANEWQVCFMYNAYGVDKKLHPVWESVQTVNPYRLVAANNNYYLVGNIDVYDNLTNFRLDKITQIELTDKPRKNIRDTVAGTIRLGAYLAAHPYMLTGEPVHIVARLEKKSIEVAIDAFGDNFTLSEEDDGTVTISAQVNEEDAYYWALQNGDLVEVLQPQSLRDRLRSAVGKMRRKYLQTDADAYGEAVANAKRNGDLNIADHSVRSRIGKDDFSRLWRLSLVNTDVSDLSFVTKYRGLKCVRIVNCPAVDFSPVAELPKLSLLEIRTTNLTSIAFLRGKKLEELILSDNPVADFSPLYEMKGLNYLTIGTETAERLDFDRLRATYPEIKISVREEYDDIAPERLLRPAPTGYPSNVLEIVFNDGQPFTADDRGLEAFLREHIPIRLTEEEADFFYRRFRDGKSCLEIAIDRGIPVSALVRQEYVILRKLRHPCSSKLLAKFFLTHGENGEESF